MEKYWPTSGHSVSIPCHDLFMVAGGVPKTDQEETSQKTQEDIDKTRVGMFFFTFSVFIMKEIRKHKFS